jgi:hypothetical protein
MPLGISSVIATSTVKEGFSFLTSLLYSISNFQGAFLFVITASRRQEIIYHELNLKTTFFYTNFSTNNFHLTHNVVFHADARHKVIHKQLPTSHGEREVSK